MSRFQVLDEEDGFQTWTVVERTLNKHWRTADKRSRFRLGVGRWLTVRYHMNWVLWNVTQSFEF